MTQRECTKAEGQQWQKRRGEGYAAGRGDARSNQGPRIALVQEPAEVHGENGSQYVARHVGQAWELGYSAAYRFETGQS